MGKGSLQALTGQRARRGVVSALGLVFVLFGCQGQPSSDPPIHLNPNMDHQEKYLPYAASPLSADGAAMRTPPEGTVARGMLFENGVYYTGLDSLGDTVKTMPVEITMPLLRRGQERFNIYCSPCHGRVGDGKGIIVARGLVPPPTFHSDRIRQMPDGAVFNVITNGVRNMPAYRYQVPVDDRWAIISYLRALQRSHNAALDDVPIEQRSQLQKP